MKFVVAYEQYPSRDEVVVRDVQDGGRVMVIYQSEYLNENREICKRIVVGSSTCFYGDFRTNLEMAKAYVEAMELAQKIWGTNN